jgi:hypothetical protein
MTRVACLAIATEVSIVLISRATTLGWSTTGGMAALLTNVLVIVVTIWIVSHLAKVSLVISLDDCGVRLAPPLWWRLSHFAGRADGGWLVPWADVRRFELLVHEAMVTESGVTMRQRQVRVTTDDGSCVERALPAATDLAVLERVATMYAQAAGVQYPLVDDEGAVLAELARDEVAASVLASDDEGSSVCVWSEVEVELVGGGRELMDAGTGGCTTGQRRTPTRRLGPVCCTRSARPPSAPDSQARPSPPPTGHPTCSAPR